MPGIVFLRSGDALHLACAEEHGFQEVYTNDRHRLATARHFRVTRVDVIEGNRECSGAAEKQPGADQSPSRGFSAPRSLSPSEPRRSGAAASSR